MTLASLMSESVQILRRSGGDEYDEVPTFTLLVTVDAFVGRKDTTEEVAGRDQVVADYQFMLPAGTDVQPYDRLVHDGRTFEVVGLPAPAIKPGVGEQFRTVKALWVEG
jgi:hypothetical protein